MFRSVFLFFSFYCYVFVYFHASVTAMSYLPFLSISMRYLFFHVPFVCVYIYIYIQLMLLIIYHSFLHNLTPTLAMPLQDNIFCWFQRHHIKLVLLLLPGWL
uniref:Uncharacterized protein n=1 Tax=Aegilops tauschii subsp. strangulata TaxID=200361 RepID=A0A453Q4I6_AEGTS